MENKDDANLQQLNIESVVHNSKYQCITCGSHNSAKQEQRRHSAREHQGREKDRVGVG